MFTQETLHEYFNYDSNTGIFTWKKKSFKSHKELNSEAGSVAGGGYIFLKLHNKRIAAHRAAWIYIYGYNPENFIDHINGIKKDNRISNLREATAMQNMHNKVFQKAGVTGIAGVKFDKSRNKYKVDIIINYKSIFIGRFDNINSAEKAYKEAKLKYHPFCSYIKP